MGLSLVMSFLGIYVVESRGYPAWLYGVVCLVANLGQSLSSAWAGNLSDRIGRRPLTDEQRIPAFGLHRMSSNLGWAIGPALGGVLTLVMPYGAVFYVAAAAMIVAAFVTMTVVDPIQKTADIPTKVSSDLESALVDGLRDPLLRLLLLGTFFGALMTTQMFATFGIYLTDELGLAKADVGLLYTVNGVAVLVLQMPAIGMIKQLGISRVLPWASLLAAAGFALIGAASGFGGAAIAILVLTGAEVMLDPAHQTAIAESADPARRGRTYGVVAFAQMLGIAMAPLTGGILLDTIGDHHGAMWLTIATIGLAQTLCFLAFVRRRSSQLQAASVLV